MSQETPIRPFIRWAGSKRKLFPKLAPFWGNGYDRYLEPFAGSAALFFHLRPKTAILSDLNSELIDTLKDVRDNTALVYDQLIRWPRGKQSYYRLRGADPSQLASAQRSARFIYLNRFCFNGLYRTNNSGQFNVPYSGSGTGRLPSRKLLSEAAEQLARARLLCGDFEQIVLANARQDDFIYLDPPYALKSRRVFSKYGARAFGENDLTRLAHLLRVIEKRGARFVLTYAYCSEALHAFRKWPMRMIYTQRHISGFAKHRRKAAELIVSNIVLSGY